jgi:hypothetical protein
MCSPRSTRVNAERKVEESEVRRPLLALDGGNINDGILASAIEICRRGAWRLDILVATTKSASFLLGRFLMQLEKEGILFRLTKAAGPLGQEIVRYIGQHPGISLIMVDGRDKRNAGFNEALRPLSGQCQVALLG